MENTLHSNPHQEEYDLVRKCLKEDPISQRKLYTVYAPKMRGICTKMANNEADIPDLLQEGFIKVFSYLKSFRFEGSFEGWIKRIMVNSSLNYYKKKQLPIGDIEIEQISVLRSENNKAIDNLSVNELMGIVKDLPEGYKKVFTLSMLEGYSHKEIGKKLNISVNTSKSQLTRARISLRNRISTQLFIQKNPPNPYLNRTAS